MRLIVIFGRFQFRPSQCDALHVDLWHRGENILRDGGTYSYNTDAEVMTYFNGAAGHNIVQFDNHQQMPRLGRFLLGDWLKTADFSFSSKSAAASYNNRAGDKHARALTFIENGLKVTDDISCPNEAAVLRWRLKEGDYQLERLNDTSVKVMSPSFIMNIAADIPIAAALIEGEESRYYLEKTPIPVLEITAKLAGQITTQIEFTL